MAWAAFAWGALAWGAFAWGALDAGDLDVAGAPVWRGAFAVFTTLDPPEALVSFVSFVVREVEVTAVFTVAFVAAFLAAFVVLATAVRGAVLPLRTALGGAAGLRRAFPVRPPFTGAAARFVDAAGRLDALVSPFDGRATG